MESPNRPYPAAALSADPAARKSAPVALTITPPFVLPTPLEHARLGPMTIPVSATLAANESMDARRRRGEPVLPLAFGEAGQPVLREAAACYWARRGLPTEADSVVCGPGSKALLFGLIAAIGGDVAV